MGPSSYTIGTCYQEADVTVMVRRVAQYRLFLLSRGSSNTIGSYAQMVPYGQESLSPGVSSEMLTFL